MPRCLVHTTDLMTEVRLLAALRADGLAADAMPADAWSSAITGAHDADLIAIVDLTALDALAVIAAAVAASVPVLCFGPHVDAAALEAARAAGARAVYPRGRFLQHTAALVRQALAAEKTVE